MIAGEPKLKNCHICGHSVHFLWGPEFYYELFLCMQPERWTGENYVTKQKLTLIIPTIYNFLLHMSRL